MMLSCQQLHHRISSLNSDPLGFSLQQGCLLRCRVWAIHDVRQAQPGAAACSCRWCTRVSTSLSAELPSPGPAHACASPNDRDAQPSHAGSYVSPNEILPFTQKSAGLYVYIVYIWTYILHIFGIHWNICLYISMCWLRGEVTYPLSGGWSLPLIQGTKVLVLDCCFVFTDSVWACYNNNNL